MPELTTICRRTKREFTIEEGSEEFILKVVSIENNAFRLDLYQQGFRLAGRKERPPAIKISSMQGQALVLSMGSIYRILSDCGYKNIKVTHRRKTPYYLHSFTGITNTYTGVTMALLFMIISDYLTRDCKNNNCLDEIDRVYINSIIKRVMGQSSEETKYYFALLCNDTHPDTAEGFRKMFLTVDQLEEIKRINNRYEASS